MREETRPLPWCETQPRKQGQGLLPWSLQSFFLNASGYRKGTAVVWVVIYIVLNVVHQNPPSIHSSIEAALPRAPNTSSFESRRSLFQTNQVFHVQMLSVLSTGKYRSRSHNH